MNILSLTTTPRRLNNLHPNGIQAVIYSLINQTIDDYEIHFNIPQTNNLTEEPYIIPRWLNILHQEEKIKIYRTNDYGPITKLYPTIRRIDDPEATIIVVDDDLIYDRNLIKEHLNVRERDQNCAWGFAGLNNIGKKTGGPMDRFVIAVNEDTPVAILEHYKSVSYKRKIFDIDFNTEFIQRGWADDQLVSAYLGMKNIKKMVAQTDYIPHYQTAEEWRRVGVVESFPCIKHAHYDNSDGCNKWRKIKQSELFDESLKQYLNG